MDIPAQLVKQLRDKTGVSFMRCKKALISAEGDLDRAIEWLREQGEGVAAGKSSRAAAEGAVVWRADGKVAALLEVNCETDSVARLGDFTSFCDDLLDALVKNKPESVDALMALETGGATFESRRQEMITRIGENIQARRFELFTDNAASYSCYIHGGKLAGVVRLDVDDKDLGHDMAMQVVASQTDYISISDIPEAIRAKEQEIIAASLADSKKPAEIKARIVEGKLNKQLGSLALEEQPYLKDNQVPVKEILKKHKAKIVQMLLWRLGEGVEKREDDFVAEVQKQVAQATGG